MILSSSTEFPKFLSPASYMHALIAMWLSTCALAVAERKLSFRLIPIVGKSSMMANLCLYILRLATSSIHVNPIIGFGRTKLFGRIRNIQRSPFLCEIINQISIISSLGSRSYCIGIATINLRKPDMSFVSGFLFHYNNIREIEFNLNAQSIKKYTVRISAIAAALFILIIGGEALLHRTWINIFSTNDEQQFVIQGNEYNPYLVSEAEAGNENSQATLTTTDYAEALSFLNQDLNLATSLLDGWEPIQYFCSVDIGVNTLTVFYQNDSASEQVLLMNVLLYNSIEEASVVFEQSYQGKYMDIANQSVYITENINIIVVTWQDNNTIFTLSGNIDLKDAQKYINTYYGEKSYE